VVNAFHHSLMAARLSVEYAVGVRDGCFCAHPYLTRLLGLTPAEVDVLRADVLRNDRRRIPGAVRASAGISTTGDDVDALLDAVAEIASGKPPLVAYVQDTATGSFTSDTY
jgi:selenocysteine lyase/cysteine desulfurase